MDQANSAPNPPQDPQYNAPPFTYGVQDTNVNNQATHPYPEKGNLTSDPPYPTQQPHYNSAFAPNQNTTPYPQDTTTSSPPYPAQDPPYPAQDPPYPAQGPPYPTQDPLQYDATQQNTNPQDPPATDPNSNLPNPPGEPQYDQANVPDGKDPSNDPPPEYSPPPAGYVMPAAGPGYPAQPGYPQQPASAQYMVAGAQMGQHSVIVNQPRPTNNAGPVPQMMHCPSCDQAVMTETSKQCSAMQWLGVGGICFIGLFCAGICWCGCCLIPFCVPSLYNHNHKCPTCHRVIGFHKQVNM